MKSGDTIDPWLRLGLLRHGKSSHDQAGTAEADRPLAPRGVCAARDMGRMMAARHLRPALVLCSTALRTRETWALAAAQLPVAPPVVEVESLYDFGDGSAILETIRTRGGEAPFLLIVGHNPALQALAQRLAADEDEDAKMARIAEKFPTAALALFTCPIDSWTELSEQSNRLTDFICPREIQAG